MPRARFKSINLSNRLCGWNGTRSSPGILSIWPLCKLKSVKLPTRRDVVIERWLAKRLCICHKKSHKWVNSEWFDWAQCASFSSKVTICNMKMNYQIFSERYILSLLSCAYTKCVCAHIKPTGNEKILNGPPSFLPLSLIIPSADEDTFVLFFVPLCVPSSLPKPHP